MNILAHVFLFAMVFATAQVCLRTPTTAPAEQRANLSRFSMWARRQLFREPAKPLPPLRSELRYIYTLVPDPSYRNPGNLVQQLSTQSPEEARTHPYRASILDSKGEQHFYKVEYDE